MSTTPGIHHAMQHFSLAEFRSEMHTSAVNHRRWNGWGVPSATVAEILTFAQSLNAEAVEMGIEGELRWEISARPLPSGGGFRVKLSIDPSDEEPYITEDIRDLDTPILIDGLVWEDRTNFAVSSQSHELAFYA